jgi:hypothetical protein
LSQHLILPFPSPEQVPLPVYTRTSYGPSTMEHIAQIAYFSPLLTRVLRRRRR